MLKPGVMAGDSGPWRRVFVVSVALILLFVLMGLLSTKLETELVRAEKAQFDLRVAELKSAVLLMEATEIANNSIDRLKHRIGSNPFDMLDTKEMNYAGVMNLSAENDQDKKNLVGQWVFDSQRGTVVYFPRSLELIEVVFGQKKPSLLKAGLQFKVGGLRSDVELHKIKGLRLEAHDDAVQ